MQTKSWIINVTQITKPLSIVCTVILATCILVDSTQAQRRSSFRLNGKNSSPVKQAFEPMAKIAGQSTVPIKFNRSTIILGTVVSHDGLIVTKASEIADKEIVCVVGDRELEPIKIAVDEKNDLALLKVDAQGLTPIEFIKEDEKIKSGQIVLTVDHDATPEAIGLISVDPRRFRSRRARTGNRRQGYLGVRSESHRDGGVILISVERGTPAANAGLKNDDVIISVGGSKTDTQRQLSSAIKSFKPGQQVDVVFRRNDDERELKVKLGDFAKLVKAPEDNWGGGPFSERRFNFGEVIAHDTVIRPSRCGGPLLNSSGKAIGINIARALRVATYAVPAKTIIDFVKANRNGTITSKD